MSPLTISEMRTQGLVNELATVFDNPYEAAGLLDSIGFPRSRQPTFQATGNSLAYWQEACRDIANGLTPGGLEALLAAASELYPHNPKFQAWRSGTTGSGTRGALAPPPSPVLPPPAGPRAALARLKVFLCHAHADKPAVENYCQKLEALDVEPWLDKKSLLPGQDWNLEIRKALRASHVVIVFLSQASVEGAGFRNKEIKLALDVYDEQPEGTIFLIPARLEPCDTPERLRSFHRVDLFDPDGFDNLVRALRARAAALGLPMK